MLSDLVPSALRFQPPVPFPPLVPPVALCVAPHLCVAQAGVSQGDGGIPASSSSAAIRDSPLPISPSPGRRTCGQQRRTRDLRGLLFGAPSVGPRGEEKEGFEGAARRLSALHRQRRGRYPGWCPVFPSFSIALLGWDLDVWSSELETYDCLGF